MAKNNKTAKSTVVEDKLNIEQIAYNGLTWVNIEKPTPRETDYLAQNYPFHQLDLDDCLSRIQRSKIDEYKDYLFILLHFPLFSPEARVTVPSQVSIFIGKDYLVTLHAGVLKPVVNLFKDCQRNEEARRENMKTSGYLLYRIIDKLIDYCLPITDKIMENIGKVEDDLFDPRTPDPIEDLAELRRDIISFRRIIHPMRTVIGTLDQKARQYFRREGMEVYWGDLIDHVDKIWDTLDECKEIIDGLHETGSILASHHTNVIIRVLTIITTIMMPLTLVASIYGMNIDLPGPGPGEEGGFLSFIIILIIMLAISVTMLFFFRRRHWI